MEKEEMRNFEGEGVTEEKAGGSASVEGTPETLPSADADCAGESAVCRENAEEISNETDYVNTKESDESPSTKTDSSCPFMSDISDLAKKIEGIEISSSKSANSIHELHKLYHTEFAGRLKKMQSELEDYQEIEKGRVYDGILTEIAKIYSDNEDLVDELGNKRLKFMFMDLLQILESNGVQKQKSEPGDKRNAKHCQVVEQLDADSPDLNDTVVKSLNTGFYVENRTFVKERVHVQTYRG